jgi:hypothetical protein
VSDPSDRFEMQAESVADEVMSAGRSVGAPAQHADAGAGGSLQREEETEEADVMRVQREAEEGEEEEEEGKAP